MVGCSGQTSFTIGDRVYLDNGAVLASASSGSSELSREQFVELADTYPDDDVFVVDGSSLASRSLHEPIDLNLVDRRVRFLNGSFPVNFDGRVNCVPPARSRSPTRSWSGPPPRPWSRESVASSPSTSSCATGSTERTGPVLRGGGPPGWTVCAWHDRGVTSRPAEAQHLRDLARLRRVRDRIDREYAQPLDVEALARGAHMSAGHLSREFRLAYGESPYAYLMTRRIERAMALLRRGDLSVTEVCFAVGCSSLGTFSTRFTELVGVPPSAYRRRRRARRRGCRRAWRSR